MAESNADLSDTHQRGLDASGKPSPFQLASGPNASARLREKAHAHLTQTLSLAQPSPPPTHQPSSPSSTSASAKPSSSSTFSPSCPNTATSPSESAARTSKGGRRSTSRSRNLWMTSTPSGPSIRTAEPGRSRRDAVARRSTLLSSGLLLASAFAVGRDLHGASDFDGNGDMVLECGL